MQFIDLKIPYRRHQSAIDQRMRAVLDHGQYINGPEVAELEERLAAYTGAAHCIGVASGTDALLIALMALGIKAGDEVITTPFTFIASSEMIALLGAVPVFVDVDPRTYNLDPKLIEAALSPTTRAIMPVSLYGQCAELDAINAIAARHALPVIEDGAQSFGASYRGRRSCALSTIGTASFFPSKPLGCFGDGGACFTDNADLAKRMREIRMHGEQSRYHHRVIGVNGRLDTLQAAVLLAKLEFFDEDVAARARLGAAYSERFAALGAALTTPYIEAHNTSVFAQYTLQVDARERVLARLEKAGIPTAIHYPQPLHRQPAFAAPGRARVSGELSVAERLAARVFSVPMHPYLDSATQDQVVSAVAAALAS